ncbi:MAG: hypothetical protein O7D30_12990 [Rickettsia endosymbiont of Ixodes persulcatus]|nr:hypothetical protein [Rickettsia endosymbiont of Ixodes persulcatus]
MAEKIIKNPIINNLKKELKTLVVNEKPDILEKLGELDTIQKDLISYLSSISKHILHK